MSYHLLHITTYIDCVDQKVIWLVVLPSLCMFRGNTWSALTHWMDLPTSTAWPPLEPYLPSTERWVDSLIFNASFLWWFLEDFWAGSHMSGVLTSVLPLSRQATVGNHEPYSAMGSSSEEPKRSFSLCLLHGIHEKVKWKDRWGLVLKTWMRHKCQTRY